MKIQSNSEVHLLILPAGVIEVTEEQEEEHEAEQEEELEEELEEEEEGPGRSLITFCSLLLRRHRVLTCRGSLKERARRCASVGSRAEGSVGAGSWF